MSIASPSDLAAHTPSAAAARRRAAPWFIVEGVLLVLLGVVAAVLPGLAGVYAASVFGWVLVFSGVFGIVSLIAARHHTHVVWGAISCVVAIVTGALVVVFPLAGVVTLAIFVGAYLLIDAMAMAGLAMDQRKHGGWSWVWLLLAALASVVLAVFVLFLRPAGDATLIGIIVAIDLVVGGMALASLGIAALRAR
jgi:uncharacterized membrane protein HdeD (DUF308 family)